jgi:hypothetical protein
MPNWNPVPTIVTSAPPLAAPTEGLTALTAGGSPRGPGVGAAEGVDLDGDLDGAAGEPEQADIAHATAITDVIRRRLVTRMTHLLSVKRERAAKRMTGRKRHKMAHS